MNSSRPYHAYTAYHREPGGLRRLDFFVDRIDEWRGDRAPSSLRVLDIGCGNGNVSLALAAAGYDVTGVDFDAPSIIAAQKSAREFALTTANFLQGGLSAVSGRRFDVIVASEVLEHQKDPASFLQEIKQLLAPDGLLLLSVPNGQSLEERIRRFTTHTESGKRLKYKIKRFIGHEHVQSSAMHPHEQFFSWVSLQQVLHRNGLRIMDARPGAAMFKEFFYLVGRLFLSREGRLFQILDQADNVLASRLSLSVADGWLIAARPFEAHRPLVMHVLPTLESGGAEHFVHDLAARMPRNGFDVHVISILRGGPVEPLFRVSGIPLTVLNVRGLFGITAMIRLYQLMKRERPTVVHTHLFGADVWGRVAAKCAGVPITFSTEHNLNMEHGLVKRWVKGLCAPITTRFIAPSEAVRHNMHRREFIPNRKIVVIKNGIDMSRVILRSPHPFQDVPRLITVGRCVPQKSQETLLKALAMVHEAWTLEIIGTGPLEYDLRNLAERLGIASRIKWMGFRDDVPERLAASDIFVFPSREEGFGLALLEAAAADVPCIASDLQAFREFFEPQEATFVPAGDVPAWVAALSTALQNPSAAIERAVTVGRRLRMIESIDQAAASYAKLYRSFMTRV